MSSMQWTEFLDEFGIAFLQRGGYSTYRLPQDYNPVAEMLQNPDFMDKYSLMDGFSRVAVCRVAVVCQMVIYDAVGGPEQDHEPKGLRRHWYQYFKGTIAQPLAIHFGDTKRNEITGVETINDTAWAQRLSQVYAALVDTQQVTYKDLWVKDASRMMQKWYDALFKGCHIMVAVEKDSLHEDMFAAAHAIGAKVLVSGKGKMSRAATEKALREAFDWGNEYAENPDPFSYDTPLIVLSLSDFDYDGEEVIGPTFGNQCVRYTGPHVLEARIGIEPFQVQNAGQTWDGAWYQVKVSNRAYVRWSERKALFTARCDSCDHTWAVVGINDTDYDLPHACPMCGGEALPLTIGEDVAHGFEVEALTTYAYRAMMVDALLSVLDFQEIVWKLRKECTADAWNAANTLVNEVCAENDDYQNILKQFKVLQGMKDAFEYTLNDVLYKIAEGHTTDFEDLEDDPTVDEFKEHVDQAHQGTGPWRPFDRGVRTKALEAWMRDEDADTMALIDRYGRAKIDIDPETDQPRVLVPD